MYEKKLWCAFLCLLTMNLSLPAGWWMASAQATPVVHAVHTAVLGSSSSGDVPFLSTNHNIGQPPGVDAKLAMNEVWLQLFGDRFQFENWRGQLLTPIQDGFAIGEMPSGQLFELQSIELIDISEEVLDGLEPKIAANYPCDEFARTFIGEITTDLATLPVTGLVLKEEFCTQTGFWVMSSVEAEDYEMLLGNPVPEEDEPPVEVEIDCVETYCEELDDCYDACKAEFQDEVDEVLAAVQPQIDAAKATYDAAVAACNAARDNAHNANVATLDASKASAKTAYDSALEWARAAWISACAVAMTNYVRVTIMCAGNPFCLALALVAYLVVIGIITNLYRIARGAALAMYNAAIAAANLKFQNDEATADAVLQQCLADAEAAYKRELCAIYCMIKHLIGEELEEFTACIMACYDFWKDHCTTWQDGPCPPPMPQMSDEWWWTIPVTMDCPCIGAEP